MPPSQEQGALPLSCPSAAPKLDPEATALSKARFDTARAAHALSVAGDNGEADARASKFFRTRPPFKDTENLLMRLGSDADAIVLDDHTNAIGGRGNGSLRVLIL